MAEADLVLQFDIEPGRNPDAEIVAEALLAWVDTLRTAAAIVDPDAGLIVELVAVEPGSQRFKQLFKRIEAGIGRIEAGGTDYPLIKKKAITLGGLIVSASVGVGVGIALQPDPRIPDDQMAVFEEMSENLRRSVELRTSNQRFYGIIDKEPAFRKLKVFEEAPERLLYEVPRQDFPALGGLWQSQDDAPTNLKRARFATWDVVLIRPVLRGEARRWTFAKDGVEFSALMTDPLVLAAIHDRSLPIPFAEGVQMRIELQFTEQFDGQAWRPIIKSRRVKRVLQPLPPPPLSPLFASARVP